MGNINDSSECTACLRRVKCIGQYFMCVHAGTHVCGTYKELSQYACVCIIFHWNREE